jgi:transposase
MLERFHCETARGLYFRMAVWLASARNPTPKQVMARFEVGRATAYRVIADWRDAQGVAA